MSTQPEFVVLADVLRGQCLELIYVGNEVADQSLLRLV
jgi:hypothetical protein